MLGNIYFIWGMGLLGASLGLKLKSMGYRVAGCVSSKENQDILFRFGFDKIYLTDTNQEEMWEVIQESTGIVIGDHLNMIPDIIKLIYKHEVSDDIWITDMGPTKLSLMKLAAKKTEYKNFIGSHPMIDSDVIGPEHSKINLFDKATVFVTPNPAAQDSSIAEKVREFWQKVGCYPLIVSYKDHDRWVAYLSHGLHLMSCMASCLLKDIPEVLKVGQDPSGGSFKEMTKIAASSPEIWDEIIYSNKKEVIHYLESLEKLVKQWKEAMKNDSLPIKKVFQKSDKIRRKILYTESKLPKADT